MRRTAWPVYVQLIFPFLDLKTIYFDLGIEHRDETDDQVTIDAAHAILVRTNQDQILEPLVSTATTKRCSG